MTDSGMPRMPSRVFVALLITDSGRLTSTELADILDISPAAILRRDHVLARWESSLSEGVALVGAQTPAGERLNESVRMFAFLRKELSGMLDRRYAERDAARSGS
jgi:hypothetical protein